MVSVCRLGFRAIEKGGEDDCPVNFQFDFMADSSSLLSKAFTLSLPKGAVCLGDSVFDLGIDVGIAGECTPQVSEGLYHQKGLTVHRYL